MDCLDNNMNLLSSRINKSSKTAFGKSTEVFTAYSCQLYIQSFKVAHRGYVYFVWTSNQSQIQSLRYESNGRLIQAKETLTISLRMPTKNGKEVPLSTNIRLIAQKGEQLDEFQISMNNLSPQFKPIEIPMDRGVVNIQVRMKMMRIAEQDVNHQERGFYLNKIAQEKSMTHITGEYESLQQQLGRTIKELQDAVYLNNKLKNDRDMLMSQKQELQLQIQTMIVQITKEISVLRQHYDNRMSIRQHIYQEEIEDLVNLFNSNAEHNKKTLQTMLRQKIKAEEELKIMLDKFKIFEISIAQKNQEVNFLENEKSQLEGQLRNLEEGLVQKDNKIDQLNKDRQEMQSTISSQNLRIETLSLEMSQQRQTIQRLNISVKELQDKIISRQSCLLEKDQCILDLQGKIRGYLQRQGDSGNERELLKKQVSHLLQDRKALQFKIEEINGKFQQCLFEMQFNENVMAQLKKHSSQKEEELYSQLQGLERMYSQKINQILNSFHYEKNQLQNSIVILQHQNTSYEKVVDELQGKISACQLNLKELRAQLDSKQSKYLEKDAQIGQLSKQIQELTVQNSNLKSGSSKELQQINQQLRNKVSSLQDDIRRLKELIGRREEEMQKLKTQKQRKQQSRSHYSQKLSKYSKPSRQMQKILSGNFNNEEVKEIVIQKEIQISELRKRVDYLQDLYDGLQCKLQEIAKKYPQIDLSSLPLKEPMIQWCESEQEQQKMINYGSFQNVGLVETPKIKKHDSHTKRKDSIGAIMEKDEDTISNSSLRVKGQKLPFYPRSEKRIADDYKRGVLRRQSLGKDMIQVPKGAFISMRKQGSHNNSYNHSERSGSYVKVSHSKKIKDLEDEIRELHEKLQEYQKQIEANNKTITALKREIKVAKDLVNENRPLSPKYDAIKVSQQSQVFIEDQRFKSFMQESQMKQFQMHKMNLRLGDLQDNLKNEKSQGIKKIGSLQFKIAQYQKKLQDSNKRCQESAEYNKQLLKAIEEMQQKLKRQKQSAYESIIKAKQCQMLLQNAQNQAKKMKAAKDILEEKLQKLSGSQITIRQLTKQIEELGKKGLEQTRVLNHFKLQKDAIEEQLRLLKKRHNQHTRIATEWQQKAASLERTIEQHKRKEGKLKRQIEEGQEQIRRAKFNMKKVEEDLQTLNSAQSQWQTERRKHLDQINNLQDQMSKKDYELNKVSKELMKWKQRAQQREQQRIGKKGELRQQIDRLQSELIRRQKRILQQSQENKLLRGRLELLQRENKRIVQQKNQTYGQKLKYYVDQMGNIKKLLDSYQQENTRLKVDNTQLFQQLQMLRMNYDKMQIKYQENIEREENMLVDLQAYLSQINSLKQNLVYTSEQLQAAESAVVSLRKELDDYRLRERKIGQKLQIAQKNYQKCLVENKDLKVKINELETKDQINGKMAERYKALERKRHQLQEEYRKIKHQYDSVVNVFIYKREDLQKCVSQARAHQKRTKQQEIQRISQQSAKTIASKTQRLQNEILELYNQNNRSQAELQTLLQQNGKQKARLVQLETMNSKLINLPSYNEELKSMVEQLKGELKEREERIDKLDYELQSIQAQCNTKQRDISNYANRIKELEKIIQKLTNELQSKRNSEREMQDMLLNVNNNKNRSKLDEQYGIKQRQSQLIQHYQSKIIAFQSEIQRLKDKQTRSIQQNGEKMKKLQQKMDEMQQALKQRQKAMEGHYEGQMRQLQSSLLRLSQQLQEKIIRIDELNEAVILLQNENKDLVKQNQQIKYQLQDEREMLEQQLTKLKNKFKQTETHYSNHLKSLEQDILKQKNNISSSRVKNNEEERAVKRYQQKMKTKDRKIDQLKDNVCSLEQTIVKLKKKESSYESALLQLQKMKSNTYSFEQERQVMENKYQQQLTKNSDIIRELRREVIVLKESEQGLRLISEEKTFENQSISNQLKTVKELYEQLQREIEKRKNNLTAQLSQDTNLQLKLRDKEKIIKQLQRQLNELSVAKNQLQAQAKKKTFQIRKYMETIHQYSTKQETHIQQINKLTNQLTKSKKILQQLSVSSERERMQANKAKMEVAKMKKNLQEGKSNSLHRQQKMNEFKLLNEELMHRVKQHEQAAKRYHIISQKSKEILGEGIEQAIDRFILYMQEKENEVASLAQQIEELKFINDRKYLDYDMLKKQNCDLKIKVEDVEQLSSQIQSLRKICDVLQQQKKSCMFREQVLRIQLQNLANSQACDVRGRVQAILSNNNIPTYTNFTFY